MQTLCLSADLAQLTTECCFPETQIQGSHSAFCSGAQPGFPLLRIRNAPCPWRSAQASCRAAVSGTGAPIPDVHVCYRGKPTSMHSYFCLPLGQSKAWDAAKAAGAVIGEKLGRNGKQEMKGENKHSLSNSHTAVVPG